MIVGELLSRSSPTHPQELSNKRVKNKIVALLIDSRREHRVRFGYRKPVGTTETPRAKKVVYR